MTLCDLDKHTELLPIQGNPESYLDHTATPDVVVDVPPAAVYDLKDKNERHSVPGIPQVEEKSHEEPSPNLRPGAPVSSWMMGCSFDERLKRYKEPPTLVGK